MLKAFLNIFKIPDLRNKALFTIAMLVIYRIGFWIPLPGVDQSGLKEYFERAAQTGSAAGTIAQFISIFTGGNLGQSTLFGLGIMPYISAAIIFQLLATVLPSLESLRKEGPAGQQKIQEYTRYATVGLCIIQAVFWLKYMQSGTNPPLVYPEWRGTIQFWLTGVVGLTAGTVFLMWLGEQIDKYGIGNGASLIITAGIVARIPSAILQVVGDSNLPSFIYKNAPWIYNLVASEAPTANDSPRYTFMTGVMLAASFVFVVAGCVLITQGQRRIPVQQAKHTRGRRVYGGQKSYLPLRVNHGGVMPIIFASSLLIIPMWGFRYLQQAWPNGVTNFVGGHFQMGQYLYELVYIILIYFFAYFWTTVQFQPREISINLRDHGSFIPGLRPGPRTAEYLERVMERITYVGAGFLAIIAVLPSVIAGAMKVDLYVTSFLGGTALLISVSVFLDLVQRVEANLLMRNYQGFLGDGGGGKGPRIRGPRST